MSDDLQRIIGQMDANLKHLANNIEEAKKRLSRVENGFIGAGLSAVGVIVAIILRSVGLV